MKSDPRVLWISLGSTSLASSRVRAYTMSAALAAAGIESRCVVGTGLRGRLRVLSLLARHRPTVIVVQKILYGRLMWRLLAMFRSTLVWDCDDALHLGQPGDAPSQVDDTAKLVDVAVASVGIVTTPSRLLAAEFRPRDGEAVVIKGPAPEVVSPPPKKSEQVLLWLGSPSAEGYLELIGDVPADLTTEGWRCVAVGATGRATEWGWTTVDWSPESESEWLNRATVGVMPQPRDPWADRKQGYKLYEYLSRSVVPVMSDCPSARLVFETLPLPDYLFLADVSSWKAGIHRAHADRDALLPPLRRLTEDTSASQAAQRWLSALRIDR